MSQEEFIHVSKQQASSYQENERFLSCSHMSQEEFVIKYKKIYCTKAMAEELYLQILTGLEKAVLEDNVKKLQQLCNYVDYINNLEDEVTLRDYYDNDNNPLKNTNLIILACKSNKVKILEYLLDNSILSICIRKTSILPVDEDETCHNAFYYAIRSSNIELVDILIKKWPYNYFGAYLEKCDEILSQAYEELKIKNVPLSKEMEIFIENKLTNLRFFSNTSKQDRKEKGYLNIRERVELVLQNISLLIAEYSTTEKINNKFLFIAKFIAQNIHILKRHLKSTYDKLPWEEIEFCLVSFVSSYIKRQEINIFYRVTLNKIKILNHLENFAKRLKDENDIIESMDVNKFVDLPKLNREQVVADIVRKYPQFGELYSDYKQIRDIHSLEKIKEYIELAVLADPKQRDGQLIIIRVLQVIGEFFKNTLESPNLSSSTSEILLLSLPKNTRQAIIDLRNSLSHAHSLSKRTEIEESTDVNFFNGVQNDTKMIYNVITDILYNSKNKIMRILLNKITVSESLDKIKEFAEIFSNVELLKMVTENLKVMEHEKLEKIIKELSLNITDKTNYEMELFNKMYKIIHFVEIKSENIRTDYITSFTTLIGLCKDMNNKIVNNVIGDIKFIANRTLKNMAPKIGFHNLKEIAELVMQIYNSARVRIPDENLDNVNRLACEIFYIAEFETGDLKWIQELRQNLNTKGSFKTICKKRVILLSITEEKYNNQLALKLSELKSILENNVLSGNLIDRFPSYKTNKKLQAVVEMLLLDIMSILGKSEKHLENNLLFLDVATPLLTGKCLRNHLAHDNTLIDILVSDPSIAIISNAEKFISENISKKKFGKFVKDDPSQLKNKYNHSLITITNQENMFAALEEGNLEDLKNCLKKGADIKARDVTLSTTLHIAARGSSVEIIKFILDQNIGVNVKDVNGQSPLHIAAAYGRKNIAEFFVKEGGVYVDDRDNNKKTPLLLAAQNGHKDTVEILLQHKANSNTNIFGFSPLHYAIRNNHIEVVMLMLKKEKNVDINETTGGLKPLHVAAEFGCFEVVNFLLRNEANINAKTDWGDTPLHFAASNGSPEVVNVLIRKGSDVNSRAVDGSTPLHNAIKNGHEKIFDILLKNGADVNAVEKAFYFTPLHYAAKDGHENIVKALLKNKANASFVTVDGFTPLHFAVKNNHLKIVTSLLEYGVNINAKDKNNATPLYYAAESGHKEVAELLIKHCVKINDKAYNNLTPLHVAVLNDHKDIIKILIRKNADVRAWDIKGRTPLHSAAIKGSRDIIDLLIKNKAEVDARTNNGSTPLHVAAQNGHEEATNFLIKNKAEVNIKMYNGVTPLHTAILGGHKDIVNLLIINKADVNKEDISGRTPLHVAVEAGHKGIVELLIANKANINIESNLTNLTPLLSAIKHNHKEIVKILIENGANINAENGEPIFLAVFAGFRDIVEILIKNNASINMKDPEDATTPLHSAAKRGNKAIVNILLTKGAIVDAVTIYGVTPLYLAAEEGHEEVVTILIENGSNINLGNVEGGTPLHIAAGRGYVNVVEVLLRNGAKINVKDNKSRTPMQLAVAQGYFQVGKMLLQHNNVDMNAKVNDNWTILHIASLVNNLEMIKWLVDNGSNINAIDDSGTKPIHIAAGKGHLDTVKYFLSKGLSVNERGISNQTLLHYTASQNQKEAAKYLIAQGADIDPIDNNGLTPMHLAAQLGFKEIIEVLLKNGAVYDAVDKFDQKPLEITNNQNIIDLLTSTKKLFESVKRNSSSEVENYIREGAFVNAKNSNSGTPLHYAAWRGYDEVVNILLQNKANPNSVSSKGFTPLHYAAKFSHIKIVKALLFYGTVYDTVSYCGKSASDFTVDKSINRLFKLVSESFKKVKDDNAQVINDLNKIKDIETVKAVMGARNRENKTLVVAAIHGNFSKVDQLKLIWQSDVSIQVCVLANQGNYQNALCILIRAFERRKEILGPDNPGTLDIQVGIGKALYKQGSYHEALNMLEDSLKKQKKVLGSNNEDTLNTRSTIALVLHKQGKDEEAFNIFQEVYQKQKEILGTNHPETLNTHFHMALVLDTQQKYEEALNINSYIFERRKKTLGPNNIETVNTQNSIATVLAKQGKHEESIKIFKEVLEKYKMFYGANHADTLRTLRNIAVIQSESINQNNQNKHHEALKVFQEILDIQKKSLQKNHPETLNTQYSIADVFLNQGKYISALRVYSEILDPMKAVYGPSHPTVLNILKEIKFISNLLKLEGIQPTDILQNLKKYINIAASNGDVQTVQRLLKDGADVNDDDAFGRTPLHFAVSNGHLNIVNILLQNGANVTHVTNKGNTPLHTATAKGYKEIIEVLLQHVSCNKLIDFLNAKTNLSGTTSLHVAARDGSLEILKLLLKHGATYKIENKEGKIPVDLSKDQKVTNLLKSIDEYFRDIKNDNVEVISKLKAVKPDEFLAITNARNIQGITLLQFAIFYKHKNIASKLLELLKMPNLQDIN